MTRLYKIILLSLFLISYSLIAPAQFKVVGYVTVSKYLAPDYPAIQFSKITHLNLAFINPDSSGTLKEPRELDSLVQLAHLSKVKVLASIGGGNSPAFLQNLLKNDNRKKLIDSILAFISVHDLDGEDVDLEGDAVDNNYASFINELRPRLKKNNKLLTAALASYYASKISNNTLGKFDFINVMSYDYTGPWTPKEPGQHSSYTKALEDIDYWILTRHVPKNKVILGVPFYGYQFNKDSITGSSFKNIILNQGAEITDTFKVNDSSIVYYNGLPTMRNKIKLALNKAGGIMIWQLYQDATGENSLLNAIDKEIEENKIYPKK